MSNALSLTDTEERVASRMTPEGARSVAIGRGTGLQITDMNQAMEMAKMMAVGGVAVRKHLRGNPGVCLAVVAQALEWEMSPYAVANKSYAVNDQLAFEAQLLNAVVLARVPMEGRPSYTYDGNIGTTRTCTVTIKLRGGQVIEHTSPQVSKIQPKNSPLWKSDEDQQLGYHTIRAMARRHFPDILLGVVADDEAMDMGQQTRDVTPAPVTMTEKLDALAGTTEAQAELVEDAEVIEVEDTAPEEKAAAKRTRQRKATPEEGAEAKADPVQTVIDKAADDPTVKAVLEKFPGSEIADVRVNEVDAQPEGVDTVTGSDEVDVWDDLEDDDDGPTDEEERILTRLGQIENVPSWVDDVKYGRLFLNGYEAAEKGQPFKTMPAEIKTLERQDEGKVWAAGHDAVTGDGPEARKERAQKRRAAQGQ